MHAIEDGIMKPVEVKANNLTYYLSQLSFRQSVGLCALKWQRMWQNTSEWDHSFEPL